MSVSKTSIQDQYYQIVNHTNIVSKTDVNGIITFVNQKFIDISGYTFDELIGQPHNMIRDPDADSLIFKDLWDTIQAKKVWNGKITNIKKDGSKYVVNSSIFPILSDNGDILEYIAIRHDITQITEINTKIEQLYSYTIEQEKDARIKLENGIVNDFEHTKCQTLYIPSDILSGDFYSIYKRKDGSIFLYLIDGQGHGVTPALTVFSISSIINNYVYKVKNLDELVDTLYPIIKNFLGEIEQLSYTMIMLSSDKKELDYASAGMYPVLLKKDKKITKLKANNTPFMNFSHTPEVKNIQLGNWDSLIVYSDGIIEHEFKELDLYTPENLIKNPSLIESAKEDIPKQELDDDVTIIYLKND